ncbi:Bcr/CflA family drug resistance efflux transporter [Reticulibacter mediterranei]|uniref:Bcr/CflA family drug resistance efflux transporter n=1 Tax=Reticulibacter mediterranei TaxID=2778369 RepID=A0A8J3IJ55_9CHLR|nr:multidrug effflux MFS transporter [Reticulibacter mediterranei]GHO95501.1 Bcr/CflA family drug resistance efflux transporter [Reticulibacter mediterranei]
MQDFSLEQQRDQAVPVSSKETSTRVKLIHVLILGGLNAFGPLSTDMYLPSLPAISRDLGATMAQTQITLSACILGLALGQVIAGPISDAIGRRRPLLIGIAAYVLASLLCVFAPSVATLTILRFVQGFAGAAGLAIALATASDLYSGVALARCFALLMLVQGISPIVAPVVGSQLLVITSWHGVFVTLALIGVFMLLASAFGLGETLPMQRRQSGGLVATLGAFRDLLLDRRFIGYALSSGFAFAACIVYISVSPFVLQNIYGVSPQIFGLLFGINALGLVIMSQVSGRLVGRIAPQKLLAWGMAAIAIGGVALLVVVLSGIGLVGVLASAFVITGSLGFIMPNITTLALSDTKAAGSASALLGVLQLALGAITAPLVGLGGTASALPMAAVMAAFAIATLVTFLVLCRPARVSQVG